MGIVLSTATKIQPFVQYTKGAQLMTGMPGTKGAVEKLTATVLAYMVPGAQ